MVQRRMDDILKVRDELDEHAWKFRECVYAAVNRQSQRPPVKEEGRRAVKGLSKGIVQCEPPGAKQTMMRTRLADWAAKMVSQKRFAQCFHVPRETQEEDTHKLLVNRSCYEQSPMCLGGPHQTLGCHGMAPFRDVARLEMQTLGSCTEWVSESSKRLAKLRFGDKDCYPRGGDSNIEEGGFLFRGVYGVQVENWMRHFRSDQLLPLQHKLLTKEPRKALAKVYTFLGLETPEAEPMTRDELDGVIARLYPGFAKEGWVIEGHYEKLDDATRDEVHQFFEPYNEHLRLVLRRSFGWSEEQAATPF